MLAAARAEHASGESGAGTNAASTKPHKKRVRNFTADDRAAHRIFEKKRRELFRERLNDLARELPALAGKNPSRLSKHDVVDESISRHRLEHNACLDVIQALKTMLEERDELLAEVNTWRATAGIAQRQATSTQMDLTELSILETKIRGDETESPANDANQTPVTEKQVVFNEHQQSLLPKPACSPPNKLIPTTMQTAHWNQLEQRDRLHITGSLLPPTSHLPRSDALMSPSTENIGLIDARQPPSQIGQTMVMPIKYPLDQASENGNTELHSENIITQPILHDLLPFGSMPAPGNQIALPDWCPEDTDFPVSMTSMDFNTDTILQRYCF